MSTIMKMIMSLGFHIRFMMVSEPRRGRLRRREMRLWVVRVHERTCDRTHPHIDAAQSRPCLAGRMLHLDIIVMFIQHRFTVFYS